MPNLGVYLIQFLNHVFRAQAAHRHTHTHTQEAIAANKVQKVALQPARETGSKIFVFAVRERCVEYMCI